MPSLGFQHKRQWLEAKSLAVAAGTALGTAGIEVAGAAGAAVSGGAAGSSALRPVSPV